MSQEDRPSAVDLARRLTLSERLQRRRFELLPLTGPGAAFADVQGRRPGETTAPAALVDLISSIASVGVLQPILVEELHGGRRRLVAGERRLRAAKWGATSAEGSGNPHFAAVPAVVCPGPLSEEERRTWQLVENLAREDLRPGELAAALVFERCAVLTAKLLGAGVPVPDDILCIDDPVERFRRLERLRGANRRAAASWPEVLRRLGIQVSPRQARALAAAFAALPRELSADMDAHRVALATRVAYLRLDAGRRQAAAQLWEAVKTRGRPELLGAAVRECLDHPSLTPGDALDRAADLHVAANRSRSERLRTPEERESDQKTPVPVEVVDRALDGLRALVEQLRAGAVVDGYRAGSLRLFLAELRSLLDEGDRPAEAAA